MLDIHQISTGRGNAALCVFPDGTTMLLDAGAAADGQPLADTDPRPNASKRSGQWIADYIAKMGVSTLDYAVITHFHVDHMGGLRDVAAQVPIATLIDRGHAYLKPDDAPFRSYEAFAREHGSEALRVGRNDQIVLRRAAAKYPTFEVRNVAANGVVWTGSGETTVSIFPEQFAPEDKPSENMCSIGLRIRYGSSTGSAAATCRVSPTPARRTGSRWRPRWRRPSAPPTCTWRITTARSIRRARSSWPRCARR
jgi:hypothetical protein